MKNNKRVLSLFCLLMVSLSLTACNNKSKEIVPTNMTLVSEGVSETLDTFTIIEHQSIKLIAEASPSNKELTYKWEVSDETIAKVEDGVVTGLKSGSAFLKVICNEYPNLSKLAIINVQEALGQTGVGSGKSAEDPLFIGNEGKDRPVEVHFIEVTKQYGDAVYIKKGNLDILIDAGTSGDGTNVKNYIAEHMEDKILDLVMVSHAHADHYGGMAEALSAVDSVSMFIDYGGNAQSTYTKARDEFISKGSAFYTAKQCVDYSNGAVKEWYLTPEFSLTILNTGMYLDDVGKAENPNSVACLFKYKDFSYFTAGDLTSKSEETLIANESDLGPVTLYKASHHGSHSSNSQAILNILNPYCIGISAAIVNEFASSGHPAGAAVERFYKAPKISQNLNVYWNGVNGDCCFTSYGLVDQLSFQGSPTKKGYYYMDGENKVKATGEENKKFHETHAFKNRGYEQYLPVIK